MIPSQRTSRARFLLLALLTLGALRCHSDGSACDTCTSDSDCKAGLVCSTFSDGSKRCGSGVGSTTCSSARR